MEAVKAKIYQLLSPKMRPADYARTRFRIEVVSGTPASALEDSRFWAHVAKKIRAKDVVEVLSEDMTWYAEFLVMDAGQNWATVARLNYIELGPVEEQGIDSNYEIKYTPGTKFRVLRKGKDGSTEIKKGFASRGEAEVWLSEHLKAHR